MHLYYYLYGYGVQIFIMYTQCTVRVNYLYRKYIQINIFDKICFYLHKYAFMVFLISIDMTI